MSDPAGRSPVLGAAELLAADRAHVWHPYGPMPGQAEPLLVRSASGVRLRLDDGRELIDAMSSWWAAIHGYRHPVLDAAAGRQLESMSHVMFGGLTHQPAIELARRLVDITAEPLQHVFFTDSGSVAVEVAAKMAVQFWASAGRPAKHRLMTWRGGYHGDTLHPMSVCDPVGGMHSLWQPLLPAQVFVDAPPAGFWAAPEEDYLRQWEQALAEHAGSVAAIIVEPVVQGAGGMRFSSPAYLSALRELADRHSVLLIFDEIATGFGRTGALFAADHAGVVPDICCLGKAMTGGYLSMAATLCTGAVAQQISRGPASVLAHGPTFMANPLAAAVSLASIDLLLSQDWQASVARIEAGLRRGLAPISALPGVRDVRVLGAIGVVQLTGDVDVAAATAAAADRGVWLRPFRDLIYTMPPYLIDEDDLATICAGMQAAARVAPAAPVRAQAAQVSPVQAPVAVPASERRTSPAARSARSHWPDPLAWLATAAADRTAAGLRRTLRPRPAERGGQLDLASNDYLGLARDDRVLGGAAAALARWGAGATGSRLVTGTTELHAELEQVLAGLVGAPAALVFSSGYLANLGAVTALSGPDCLIVSDAGNHASLVDACRLSRSPVTVVEHGDRDAAARALAQRSQPRAMVVVDAVNSAAGDLLPLADWHALAARFAALLVIDDAHGLGVRGAGRGSVAEAGLAAEPDVITTITLSKALGSQGGAVLGSEAVIDQLIDRARSFLFDTGLNPAAVGAALAAARIIEAEPWLAGRVRDRAGQLARICGVPATDGAVVPVVIGEAGAASERAAALRDRGVEVGCFRPPSVPAGTARLRLAARADLTDADLERFCQTWQAGSPS